MMYWYKERNVRSAGCPWHCTCSVAGTWTGRLWDQIQPGHWRRGLFMPNAWSCLCKHKGQIPNDRIMRNREVLQKHQRDDTVVQLFERKEHSGWHLSWFLHLSHIIPFCFIMSHWFEYASISKFDAIRFFSILCKVHREVEFWKCCFEDFGNRFSMTHWCFRHVKILKQHKRQSQRCRKFTESVTVTTDRLMVYRPRPVRPGNTCLIFEMDSARNCDGFSPTKN